MALGLTKLSNVVVDSAQNVLPAAVISWSSADGTPINAGATEWIPVVNLQASATFHASATKDVVIHARKSTDNGITNNTPNVATYLFTIPITAGATVIKDASVYDFDYLDIGAENLDGTYNAVVSIKYDGYKITGMA